MTPIHCLEDNATENAMFQKDYTAVIRRLLPSNPFLEDSFIKVRTDIAYSEEVCAFVDSILKIDQNCIKNLLIHGLSNAKNLFLIQLQKIILLTPAMSTAKTDLKKMPTL